VESAGDGLLLPEKWSSFSPKYSSFAADFYLYQQPEKASKKSIFTPLDIGGGRGGVDFAFIGKQMAVPARRNPSRPPLKPKGRSEA